MNFPARFLLLPIQQKRILLNLSPEIFPDDKVILFDREFDGIVSDGIYSAYYIVIFQAIYHTNSASHLWYLVHYSAYQYLLCFGTALVEDDE